MSSVSRTPRGLPANPRPRAKSATKPPVPPESKYQPHDALSLPTNPRARRPSIPREQMLDSDWNPSQKPRRRNDLSGARNARSSGNSSPTSSSGSSFGARDNRSQASSRTSLQSDEGRQGKESGSDANSYLPSRDSTDNDSPTANAKDTGFVWNRVAEVASVFTQEFSKVWATGLLPVGTTADTEEGESHLTLVMRAYHLSKARTPSELPDWLFSDRERGQVGLLRSPPNDAARTDPAQQAQRDSRPDNHGSKNLGPYPKDSTRPRTTPPARFSGSDRLRSIREDRRKASGTQI
ncbi:hypothetical protein M413DRAFT_21429 [Hebeloma cylindrosporum]|uniref:Uncharacterized protein n=1 Tax=Hebeloma cylindrosporum TaxID=76867 RepID=A0A0C2YHF2_HEBCY|nr:hypothetical protein M413DRAFT_21429 [Hebeloma cylindrosporum h7]